MASAVTGANQTSQDVKTTAQTLSDENATTRQKAAAIVDTALSAAGTVGSAMLAASSAREAAQELATVKGYFEKAQCPGAEKAASDKIDFYVTQDGVVFRNGIPDNYVENPYRSGSYGLFDENGKFSEKLRIDPATPTGKKGPEYSHYHLDGGKEHFSPRTTDNNPLDF